MLEVCNIMSPKFDHEPIDQERTVACLQSQEGDNVQRGKEIVLETLTVLDFWYVDIIIVCHSLDFQVISIDLYLNLQIILNVNRGKVG